jgi:hypothetical protein
LIALLGFVVTKWSHLTGLAGEDDYLLAAGAPDLRLTSVVICGIIVAGLGVLNDVTITQASAVWELADQGATHKRLFSQAMRIGRDHIASTVYTIAFATAGASLGVFLLIKINNRPLLDVLQAERFAAELLSILVGSIGLVLAVPLTTAVGVAVVRASGPGRVSVRQPGSTLVRTRGPVVLSESMPPGQPDRKPQQTPQPPETTTKLPRIGGPAEPERRPEETPQPQEATTTQLPRASVRPQPAPSKPAAPEVQVKRRRSRRHDDDDFGDFSYLHEPTDSEPQAPESSGRRAL